MILSTDNPVSFFEQGRQTSSFSGILFPAERQSLPVDVAGFSPGSRYADKHAEANCCAEAQHAAVCGGLVSRVCVSLLEVVYRYTSV